MKTIQIKSTDYRAYPIVYKSGEIKDKERENEKIAKKDLLESELKRIKEKYSTFELLDTRFVFEYDNYEDHPEMNQTCVYTIITGIVSSEEYKSKLLEMISNIASSLSHSDIWDRYEDDFTELENFISNTLN